MVKVKIKVNIGSWGPPQEAAEQYAEMVARAVEFQKIAEDAEQNRKDLDELNKIDFQKIQEDAEQNQKDLDELNKIDFQKIQEDAEKNQKDLDELNKINFQKIITDTENNLNKLQELQVLFATEQLKLKSAVEKIESNKTEIDEQLKSKFESYDSQVESLVDRMQLNSGSIGMITSWYGILYNSYQTLYDAIHGMITVCTDKDLRSDSRYPIANKAVKAKFDELELERLRAEEQTRTLEYSMADNGFWADSDSSKNCRFYQYKGMSKEIPIGTKIKTIEFFVDDKWLDIRSMSELDCVSYSLYMNKVFSWDEIDANILCLWYPKNALSNKIESYKIDKFRVTYVKPKFVFYVDKKLFHVEHCNLNGVGHLPPSEPQKDGYTFAGWSVEGTTDIVEFPYLYVKADMNFVANFTEN